MLYLVKITRRLAVFAVYVYNVFIKRHVLGDVTVRIGFLLRRRGGVGWGLATIATKGAGLFWVSTCFGLIVKQLTTSLYGL